MRTMKQTLNSDKMAGKKRFIVLAVLLLLMAAGSLIYITVDGDTYTDRLLYTGTEKPDPESLVVTVDNTEVVVSERVYLGTDGDICVDFRSVRRAAPRPRSITTGWTTAQPRALPPISGCMSTASAQSCKRTI